MTDHYQGNVWHCGPYPTPTSSVTWADRTDYYLPAVGSALICF